MRSVVGKIALAIVAPWTGKRLWMTIIAIAFISGHTMLGINYLYSFTEEWKANLFFKIWIASEAGTVTIVLSYLGLQTLSGGDKVTDLLDKIIK